MRCGSLQIPIVAALLAGGIVSDLSVTIAADSLTPIDRQPSARIADDGPHRLTPDDTFHNIEDGLSVVSPLPLMRIPAIPRSPLAVAPPSDEAGSHDETAGDRSLAGPTDTKSVGQTIENAGPVQQADEADPADHTERSDPFAGLQRLGDSSPDALDNLPRLMLMTVVMLGACLGTLLVARRWLTKTGLITSSPRTSRLQIVASLSVAPRSQLHIVRLDDREVLVGVDSRGLQQIQMIAPSFDAVLQSSQERESTPVKTNKPDEVRGTQPPRRLFTAA